MKRYVLFILVLLMIVAVVSAAEFNSSDISTWAGNWEEVKKLSDGEKADALKQATPEQRQSMFNSIINKKYFASEKFQKSFNSRTLFEKTGVTMSLSSETLLKTDGFDSSYLQLKGEIISDRNIELDLNNLPFGIKGVAYASVGTGKERMSSLSYDYGDGNGIVSERGGIGADNKIYRFDKYNGFEIKFIGKDSIVDVTEKSIVAGGSAELHLNEMVFRRYKSSSDFSVEIKGDGHFKVKNAIIEPLKIKGPISGNDIILGNLKAKITTPENHETDVIFNSGDYSNLGQYIQVADKEIHIKGVFIEAEVLDDFKKITGDGRKLKLINGDVTLRFDDLVIRGDIRRKVNFKHNIDEIVNLQDEGSVINMNFDELMRESKIFAGPKTAFLNFFPDDSDSADYAEFRKKFLNSYFSTGEEMFQVSILNNALGLETEVKRSDLYSIGKGKSSDEVYKALEDLPVRFTLRKNTRQISDGADFRGKLLNMARTDGFSESQISSFNSLLGSAMMDNYALGSKIIFDSTKKVPTFTSISPDGKSKTFEITDSEQLRLISRFVNNRLKVSGKPTKMLNQIIAQYNGLYSE